MRRPNAEIHKVTGLVDLIRFFEAGGCTDAPTLVERYGLDLRTAERWLEDVQRWVPLDRKRTGYRYTYRRMQI
jgi:hypothetical protein